jgi:hypothetical protein
MYDFSIYELPANNLDTENYGLLGDDAVKPSRQVPTFSEEPIASMCYTTCQKTLIFIFNAERTSDLSSRGQ